MSLGIVVKFSNIFPTESVPELSDLLKEVPSRMCIGILSYINGSLYLADNQKSQLFFLSKLIEKSPVSLKKEVVNNLNQFTKKNRLDYVNIFSLYTVLRLIEWETINYREIDFNDSTPQQELKILKAVLVLNEDLDRRHGEIKPVDTPLELIWPVGLPQFEFNSRDLFISRILSALDFYEYLQINYPEHYPELLDYYGVDKAKTIFLKIIELFINGHNKGLESYNAQFNTEVLERNKILKSFLLDVASIDVGEYKKDRNHKYFKGLRKWPLISYGKDYFNIVNWNFLSDKFSTIAIVFDFYYNTKIKDSQRFEDFKSDIGIGFSEKLQFNSCMELCFPSKNYVKIKTEENPNLNVDYYLRDENRICLFEFKDYIMPDSTKNGTYQKIKEYFDERFIINDRDSNKGVNQLIAQIESLSDNLQKFEDFEKLGISKSRLLIYPIIVITDPNFSIPGLEHYLNLAFRSSPPDNHGFFHVHGITVIEIDFFQQHYELFKNGEETLPSLIHRHYLTLETYRSLLVKNNTPGYSLRTMHSFRHTTVSKLPDNDPTRGATFEAVVKRLGIK